MIFKPSKFCMFCLFSLFLSISCRDSPSIETTELTGKWSIDKAERDGKPTKSLNEGYFEFLEDQALFTNILNTTDTLEYSLEGKKILLEDLDYKFQIILLADDSLTLRTRINKSNYKMYLLKS